MFSRVAVGAHWLSDVGAGMAVSNAARNPRYNVISMVLTNVCSAADLGLRVAVSTESFLLDPELLALF